MFNWEGQTVYVIGGAGFIGSHLVKFLCVLGADVIVLDNLSRGRLANVDTRATIRKYDLRYAIPTFQKGAVIFHLAAKVAGIHYNVSHQMDMMQSNLIINWNVMEAVRCTCDLNNPPKAFINISTACVYPHDASIPTPEDVVGVCNPEPTNFGYGVAKWVGEQQTRYLHEEYGVSTATVRFFNAFGPRDYYDMATSHVAPALIRKVIEGKGPLVVWGSGRQSRVLVDVRDIVKALVLLAECDEALDARPINIGHAREITIEDLADMIIEECSPCKPIGIDFDTSKPEGYPRRAADTTRLMQLIGWVPDTPIEETIRDMVSDYYYQRSMGWIQPPASQ